jgi:hypothetical protein
MTPKLSNLVEKNWERASVFEPVTAKFLFTMFLNAKPNASALVTKRMEDYKKSLEKLC